MEPQGEEGQIHQEYSIQNQELYQKLWSIYYGTNKGDTNIIIACCTLFQSVDLLKQIAQIFSEFSQQIEGKIINSQKVLNELKAIKAQIYNKSLQQVKNYEIEHNQSQSNRLIFKQMENILEIMARENPIIKQLDENVEKLITELKTYLQTTLRKSLYRELFVLLHSDKLKGIYKKLDELCHEFKEQYLSKFAIQMQQKLQKTNCRLKRIYKRAEQRKRNTQSIFQQFTGKSNTQIEAYNRQGKKYQPSQLQGKHSFQTLHQRICFFVNISYQKQKQFALFALMLKVKQSMKFLSSKISQGIKYGRQYLQMIFKTLDAQCPRIKKNIEDKRQSKLIFTKKYAKQFIDIVEKMKKDFFQEDKSETILIEATQKINEVFDKFCQAKDQQFVYQVNTQLLGIRFGQIRPLIIFHAFYDKNQYKKMSQTIFPRYFASLQKDIKAQINSPNQKLFYYTSKIIEINLHDYSGSHEYNQKLLKDISTLAINQSMHQVKNIVLLFLIGHKPIRQNHYRDIFVRVRTCVRNQKNNNANINVSIRPKNFEDPQYQKTYIGPYFYFIIEFHSAYPKQWKVNNKGNAISFQMK